MGTEQRLYDILKVVVGAGMGIFIKGTIERWWKRRGKLAQARNAMYLALAEMSWEVQLFSRGIEGVVSQEWDENPDLHLAEVTNLIDRFYEHIKARDYDLELSDLRAARTSSVGEVEGFELVIGYLKLLPSSQAPIPEKLDAAMAFSKKFLKAMLTEQLDREKFELASKKQRNEAGLPRQVKRAALAIEEVQAILRKGFDVVDAASTEAAEAMQKLIDEQKAESEKYRATQPLSTPKSA